MFLGINKKQSTETVLTVKSFKYHKVIGEGAFAKVSDQIYKSLAGACASANDSTAFQVRARMCERTQKKAVRYRYVIVPV